MINLLKFQIMKEKIMKLISKIVTTLLIGVSLTSCITSNPKKSTDDVLKNPHIQREYKSIVKLVSDDGRFFCSGVVISDTQVLSAAHCFTWLKENSFSVVSIENSDETALVAHARVSGYNIRADTAIVNGDFKRFSQMEIDADPSSDILINPQYDLVACGFPYGGKVICYPLTNATKMIDGISFNGQMYAGMSGGPVIDLNTGKVLAVNHAVAPGFVIVAPIINLYYGLHLIE